MKIETKTKKVLVIELSEEEHNGMEVELSKLADRLAGSVLQNEFPLLNDLWYEL